jgi:hypothetical protein
MFNPNGIFECKTQPETEQTVQTKRRIRRFVGFGLR